MLLAWVAVGVIRVLLGSSESPVAYIFFGVFWIISVILLVAAIRQLIVSKKLEQKIESISICVGLTSLFLQGLLGLRDAGPAAAFVFLASAIVLLFIYGRRFRQKHLIHP